MASVETSVLDETIDKEKDLWRNEILAQAVEAASKGEYAKAVQYMRKLPMHPVSAKACKLLYGKQAVLDTGRDLSEANAFYGEGWLDAAEEFSWV